MKKTLARLLLILLSFIPLLACIECSGCTSSKDNPKNPEVVVKNYLNQKIKDGSSGGLSKEYLKGSEYDLDVMNKKAEKIKDEDFDTKYGDVANSVVRAYEIKNVTGDTISAEITFESKAGTDLKKTKVFTVTDGMITWIK